MGGAPFEERPSTGWRPRRAAPGSGGARL